MEYRELGRTGWKVSTIGFGAWAIGGSWGEVDDDNSLKALNRALDLGVNLFDTADVYGDGRSERLMARLRRERSGAISCRHQGRAAVRPACCLRVQPRKPDGFCGTQPAQSGDRGVRAGPAALPADRSILHARGIWHPG